MNITQTTPTGVYTLRCTEGTANWPATLLKWDIQYTDGTGNLYFIHNNGSGVADKVDLGTGAARSLTTHGFELIMFAAPNSAVVNVFIQNLHTGVVLLDTSYTTKIPAVNTGLAFKCEVRNGAIAAADNIECAKVYIESDY